MALIKLSRIERRRMTVFLSCLVVAVLTWIVISLSGKYVYTVETKINYTEPPESKAYHPLQGDSVMMEIEGTGWQLLFSRLRLNPQSVDVSLRALNSRNYIVFSGQLRELNTQFESSQRVISVSPDTLFFDFSKRTVKKVPVKLISDLTFRKTYGISGPVKLNPSHVIVNGSAEDLRKIEFWPTMLLSRQDVSADINARVGFGAVHAGNIDIYPLSVKVSVPVDKFTEKVLDVPVKVLNGKGRDVKLLPERIRITVLAALSNYPVIERDSFRVAVDLKDWQEKGYTQLPVQLLRLPEFCKLVKTEPQIVDFFIRR